jgi:hypothetical protein
MSLYSVPSSRKSTPERSKPACVIVFPPGDASVTWLVVFSTRYCGVVRIAIGQ